jgi:myo-inositol-1(or 4)-monophosphatase
VSPGGRADTVLVVDPIDGTRPALAGFESCCVSVAAAPLREGVTMGEVQLGCVVEIKSGTLFLAERGRGLLEGPPVRLSRNESIERMFWVYGFRGRPVRLYAEVLAELLDASSTGGGTFELGSASYDMTRVLTGQLDAYVEPGPRILRELPDTLAEFERVGRGAVLNNSPYDVAAAALCLTEAGAVVTDAAGEPLDDRPLLGSGPDFQMSCVASANRLLHEQILEELDAGIERLAFSFASAEETESR